MSDSIKKYLTGLEFDNIDNYKVDHLYLDRQWDFFSSANDSVSYSIGQDDLSKHAEKGSDKETLLADCTTYVYSCCGDEVNPDVALCPTCKEHI